MIKNLITCLPCFFLLSACATTYAPLSQIPVKDADFKLPPETLLAQYPDIAAHHENSIEQTRDSSDDLVKGSLSELTEKWGFPKRSKKEMTSAAVFYGYTPLINAMIFWPYFEFIVPVSAVEMIAIGPTKEVKWKKQNYVIDASFSARGENHLLSWDWYYVDDRGNETPLIQAAIKRWFIGLLVSRGYEVLRNDVNPTQMEMARGGEMTFGREFGALSDNIVFDSKVGFKVHGDGISATGGRLMYLRAHWDLGMRYKFDNSKFSTGLGLVMEPAAVYKTDKRSYLATDTDYHLMKPAVGASVDVQYRRSSRSAIFMRAEYLKLSSKSSSETIDASNVAMGMRYYF